jgi:hypothetical protein
MERSIISIIIFFAKYAVAIESIAPVVLQCSRNSGAIEAALEISNVKGINEISSEGTQTPKVGDHEHQWSRKAHFNIVIQGSSKTIS